MGTIRNWLLPGCLAAAQLGRLWPGTALTGTQPPGTAAVTGMLLALAGETAALGFRRRTPVRALAGTLAALVLGQLACPDEYLGVGVLVALYSVAVHCPVPVTLCAVTAGVGTEWLLSFARIGPHPALVAEWTIGALVYVSCAGLGEARRQWLAGRLTAARRLAAAEHGRQRAGDDERERLARELHDVSAHHLTSVVITVDAARRLGDGRPALTAEALAFAERTGTETLTALRRLVGLLRDSDSDSDSHSHSDSHSDSHSHSHSDSRHADHGGSDRFGTGWRQQSTTGRIEELVAGFGRLGRPITTELPGNLAGPAAEAVHGIVREALTNALRHAPGAAVTVTVRRTNGQLALSVDNTPGRAAASPATGGLGSGRGVAGMRARAAAAGGELTAGPGPDGGWRVRATLPDMTGPRPAAAGQWRRDVLREQRLADPALAFTATVLPLVVALAALEDVPEPGRRAAPTGLAVLAALLAVHALPLLWRRRSPWAAFAGVLATAWLWPVAVARSVLPPGTGEFVAGGVVAELAAVYALAVYGRGAARTWPSPVVAAAGTAAVWTATAAADGELGGEAASGLVALAIAVPLCLALCVLFLAPWGAGLAVRRRRLRVLAHEDHALASTEWHAGLAADAERRRLAARLHDAVLDRTAALVEHARQERLADVAVTARSALAAMRELLHGLGDTGAPGPQDPAPTLADLEPLCRSLRTAGRDVTLRGLPGAAAELPPAVALSAYRIVEAALGAGDRNPARVTLRRRRGTLHLTVTGVRLAVAGPVAERLRVRAGTGEGRIAFDPAGTVRVSLPAGSHPAPAQEVSPSSYA
ncbi:sensor histidine kinase [Streptomyces sp. NPDC059785]|uniref:sensor histidine kinase n=1 Tax=Streptomyces sp. NPDC059785 TaxID=3346945 RepID=UPI0036565486